MTLTAEQEARLTAWAGDDTSTDGLIAACERAGWGTKTVTGWSGGIPVAWAEVWAQRGGMRVERTTPAARDALALAIIAALDAEQGAPS